MGRCWLRGYKVQLCGMNHSRDLRYRNEPITNNAVLNIGNMMRD